MYDKEIPYNDLPPISLADVADIEELTKLAEKTRVSLEVLNYAVGTLPKASVLLDTLAFQEAKASSDIENIVTTNDELYREILFDNFTAEAKEVADYKRGLYVGYEALQRRGVVAPSDLVEINKTVNKKKPDIRNNLEGFDNDITRIVNKASDGSIQTVYTPPHGKELIQKLLIDMLDYIYDDENNTYHPLIKIALAHYQFESIHPFRDGNGRTGRILNVLMLCQKKYLDYPVLYASSYIIKHKSEYYELLNITHETEQYSDIVRFMLNSFNETARKTLRIVEGIKKLLEQYKSENFLGLFKVNNDNRELLWAMIDRLFEKAYVRINDLVEVVGLHRQTASVHLDKLVDCGVLSKSRVGRDNIYKNVKLFELFEEVNNGE